MGYKIREAEMNKVPYMLVVGAQEAERGTANLRTYRDGKRGELQVATSSLRWPPPSKSAPSTSTSLR